MISALLHILGAQEVPRSESTARRGEKFEISRSSVQSESPSSGVLREMQRKDLRAINIKRPLLADEEPLAPPIADQRGYSNFMESVSKLVDPPRSPEVDIFE